MATSFVSQWQRFRALMDRFCDRISLLGDEERRLETELEAVEQRRGELLLTLDSIAREKGEAEMHMEVKLQRVAEGS